MQSKSATIKSKKNIQSSKSTRKERAQQRIKLKPLRDKLDQIEKTITQATEAQQELDRHLADPEIYNETNQSRLHELLSDQARNTQLQKELERRWLATSELLEQASVPFFGEL